LKRKVGKSNRKGLENEINGWDKKKELVKKTNQEIKRYKYR
jgi:hypothetical protein